VHDVTRQQLNHEIVVISSRHELTCMHLHHHTHNSNMNNYNKFGKAHAIVIMDHGNEYATSRRYGS